MISWAVFGGQSSCISVSSCKLSCIQSSVEQLVETFLVVSSAETNGNSDSYQLVFDHFIKKILIPFFDNPIHAFMSIQDLKFN